MDRLNGGFVALAIVGLIFISLQVWWISMTIKNGTNDRLLMNTNQIDHIKKRLEKIFRKTD